MQFSVSNRQILKLALPISMSLLIPQVSFMANAVFLGRLGQMPLVINGLCSIFYLLLTFIGFGLSNGIMVQLSRRAGEGDHEGLARTLTLFGASAAQVDAIDSVFTNFRDEAGLRAECVAARRDGFTGKMAIHPAQVAPINEVFAPSPEALAKAEQIIALFAANPGAGVIGLHGEMLDRPHLIRAERPPVEACARVRPLAASGIPRRPQGRWQRT